VIFLLSNDLKDVLLCVCHVGWIGHILQGLHSGMSRVLSSRVMKPTEDFEVTVAVSVSKLEREIRVMDIPGWVRSCWGTGM
jgi:hypothetical protein